MIKKIVQIFSVYLAFGIVLAHSFVPHDHELESNEYIHHNHADHCKLIENHDCETDLSHIFEDFHHDGEFIEFIKADQIQKNVEINIDHYFIDQVKSNNTWIDFVFFAVDFVPPDIPRPSVYLSQHAWRGPPSLI